MSETSRAVFEDQHVYLNKVQVGRSPFVPPVTLERIPADFGMIERATVSRATEGLKNAADRWKVRHSFFNAPGRFPSELEAIHYCTTSSYRFPTKRVGVDHSITRASGGLR